MTQVSYLSSRCSSLGRTWREVVRRVHDAGCPKAERTVYEYYQGGTVPREMLPYLADALDIRTPDERREMAVALGFGDLVDFIGGDEAA